MREPMMRLFYLIAEPRVIRVIQLFIYLCMLGIGLVVLFGSSPPIQSVLGPILLLLFGGFLVLGGALGAVAVLPGIWWMERAGVIGVTTGLAIYAVVVITLGTTSVGALVVLGLIFMMIKRWMEIRPYQHAPKG